MCSDTVPVQIWSAGKKRLKFFHKRSDKPFKVSLKWRSFQPPLLKITVIIQASRLMD
jgi:hypothetical protein